MQFLVCFLVLFFDPENGAGIFLRNVDFFVGLHGVYIIEARTLQFLLEFFLLGLKDM
jgi:hypothetical protein